MKKNTKVLHKLSSVACSVGLFNMGVAHAENSIPDTNNFSMDSSYFMDIMDGNGGGYIAPTFTPAAGGTFNLSATSSATSIGSITFDAQCAGSGDHISCAGFAFNISGNTPALTFQGTCSGTTYTPSNVTVSCVQGTTYNINLVCVNDTTGVAMRNNSPTVSFTCFP